MSYSDPYRYRTEPRPDDRAAVAEIAKSSGFFRADEVEVAEWLVNERLEKGDASGYFFRFAERSGMVIGFTCHGPISGCDARYDLYWIAVHDVLRGRGLGRSLLQKAEADISKAGGRRVYIDTSARPDYASTRLFYERNGYAAVATLDDFYRQGDGKTIYLKVLAADP